MRRHRGAGPTPACAGSTSRIRPASTGRRAYPRLRGEHGGAGEGYVRAGGLPPLARGAPSRPRSERPRRRPTPACAGSTWVRQPRTPEPRAYPRLRGEHGADAPASQLRMGLPPLARGAPARTRGRGGHAGPTPACAGSTATRRSGRTPRRAYPRLRGEHKGGADVDENIQGLPPLARGAPGRAEGG